MLIYNLKYIYASHCNKLNKRTLLRSEKKTENECNDNPDFPSCSCNHSIYNGMFLILITLMQKKIKYVFDVI